MSSSRKISYCSPSSQPSPPGEGELAADCGRCETSRPSYTIFANYQRTDPGITAHSRSKPVRQLTPLPGGEGQGEGVRDLISAVSATVHPVPTDVGCLASPGRIGRRCGQRQRFAGLMRLINAGRKMRERVVPRSVTLPCRNANPEKDHARERSHNNQRDAAIDAREQFCDEFHHEARRLNRGRRFFEFFDAADFVIERGKEWSYVELQDPRVRAHETAQINRRGEDA